MDKLMYHRERMLEVDDYVQEVDDQMTTYTSSMTMCNNNQKDTKSREEERFFGEMPRREIYSGNEQV
jgi:hypothetical protein